MNPFIRLSNNLRIFNMNQDKFPSSFQLGAVTWKINDDSKEPTKDDAYGQSQFTARQINLSKEHNGRKIPLDAIEQTMYHEVTHAILGTLGEHKLSNDEEFVQKFSLLLHQFEKTKK